MNTSTYAATAGALLHDIGKLAFRAGEDGRGHSLSGAELAAACTNDRHILDCVRFHHSRELRNARLEEDSPAYAVYIADNIAAGADRRDSGEDMAGFDARMPLSTVFASMRGAKKTGSYHAATLDVDKIPYPENDSGSFASTERYCAILAALKKELAAQVWDDEHLNSLLSVMESCCGFVPSSTARGQTPDISLFDHVKLTAAVASCICEYLLASGERNWRRALMDEEKEFMDREAFLLYTADLSGIQSFLYNIPSKGAMRSLKSRSLTLELIMEHHIDELLDGCGLSRCALIYNGGGHCYILLPNTSQVQEAINAADESMRKWLIEYFGAKLYMASAFVEATANTLMNKPLSTAPLKQLFIAVSRAVAASKAHRYTADELRALNRDDSPDRSRECSVCGRHTRLTSDGLCSSCQLFERMAAPIGDPELCFLVTPSPLESCVSLSLPSVSGAAFMNLCGERFARRYLASGAPALRVYSKNRPYTGQRYARNIFIGDYTYRRGASLEELAEGMEGIRRLAVLRCDVDDLGAAFISGFERDSDDPQVRYRYVTLSRIAAFSRQMSMFFRCYVNSIMAGNGDAERKKVAVVYSGGDDMFIVGAWGDVLDAAGKVRQAFGKYCVDSLTLSAGIGIYPVRYPIAKSSLETGELVELAKGLDGKDAVALFDESSLYRWDRFENSVIKEKLAVLNAVMISSPGGMELGMSMLYKMTALLRQADERINVARFAYLLSRLSPGRNSPKYDDYEMFSKKMYTWLCSPEDRRELLTAMNIYAYMNRGGNK